MDNAKSIFLTSIDLKGHPLKRKPLRIRIKYFAALSYIVEQTVLGTNTKKFQENAQSLFPAMELNHCVRERLKTYAENLGIIGDELNGISQSSVIALISRPWQKKIRYWLICDVAMILVNPELVHAAEQLIKNCLSARQGNSADELVALYYDDESMEKYGCVEYLISQYRKNYKFFQMPEQQIVVTANVSAGKSTLINALVGKPITRTSQETCTGNISLIYNKAFEDDNVHLYSQSLTLHADEHALAEYPWNKEITLASYFSSMVPLGQRLCLIDTPGVNAALYRQHKDITHKALLSLNYEKILYVLNPTSLGSDAEIENLKWVAQNISDKQIFFVLNKLDEYHIKNDSIQESIKKLESDLLKIGFHNPIICPISARFSLLLKMKSTHQPLTEDEQDEYELLSRKFSRNAFDLSGYYVNSQPVPSDTEEIRLSKRAGLFGLEKLLYGGIL